ncbi:MAG: hypothetical protein ALAOOOJD_00984 [bacterium]|nr:hypothetical protein [bacterium]
MNEQADVPGFALVDGKFLVGIFNSGVEFVIHIIIKKIAVFLRANDDFDDIPCHRIIDLGIGLVDFAALARRVFVRAVANDPHPNLLPIGAMPNPIAGRNIRGPVQHDGVRAFANAQRIGISAPAIRHRVNGPLQIIVDRQIRREITPFVNRVVVQHQLPVLNFPKRRVDRPVVAVLVDLFAIKIVENRQRIDAGAAGDPLEFNAWRQAERAAHRFEILRFARVRAIGFGQLTVFGQCKFRRLRE